MKITDLMIKNFLSIGEAHYQFPTSGLVLLSGFDEDLGRSNGAGKSSFFHSLCWCLYGELPKEIKVEELIRRGEKVCAVAVKFDIDGTVYTVVRKRPSSLEVLVGKEKLKGNPKYLQAFIETTIGLSYKQFLITSYFPQKGDSSRFIKQTDALAKDFLSTILSFNKTEQAYKKIHLMMKDQDTLLSTKSGEVSSLESSINRFKSIAEMPSPEMPNKAEILRVKGELDLVNVQTANEPDTAIVDGEIAKFVKAIASLLQRKMSANDSENKIKAHLARIAHLETSEAHTLTCPSCAADLLESQGSLVQFDAATAEQIKADKISTLRAEIVELEAKLAVDKSLMSKEPELQKKLDDLRFKRQQARHDYDMGIQKKSFLQEQMQAFKKAIVAAQQSISQKDQIITQLSEMQGQYITKSAELQDLQQELMELAAAKAVMSPTGAIAYSLDSVMEEINSEVGQYLDIFSHNSMSYRITSGDDKAKVTHTINKNGQDVSVGSLSGGEERGLILSVDLGLSEVIVKKSGVNLPSVLMLDECFDGLDYIGKEKVIDALREIANDRCIIVIDHSTEMCALFDQSIRVVKKNEVSRLEIE